MPTPIILEVKSEQYGVYWAEFVGIVDFAMLLSKLGVRHFSEWSDIYDPFTHFQSHNRIMLHDHIDEDGRSMNMPRQAIFVATAQTCKDWDYHASVYGQSLGRRKRKFPLMKTKKEIEKWQNSLPDNLLLPEWATSCKTVEELKAADRIINPLPCQRCYAGRI